MFNNLVHLLRLMKKYTLFIMFAELLEFTKPSGISSALCIHIINKLFNCIFLCAGDICAKSVIESRVCNCAPSP